jgi:hypothetical protein
MLKINYLPVIILLLIIFQQLIDYPQPDYAFYTIDTYKP